MRTMHDKQIILLGGRGFLGKYISMYLKGKGYKVKVVDKDEINLVETDSWKKLEEYIGQNNIIINLAAIKRQDGDNKSIKSTNNNIVNNVVRGVKEAINKGVDNSLLIHMSSCAVYGEENEQNQYKENSKLNPTSLYGEHKVEAEEMIKGEIPKTNSLILRPPLIYGDNDDSYGPTRFRKNAMHGEPIRLWGNGKEKRSFLYINDMAYISEQMIKNRVTGTINTCNSESVSYAELVSILRTKYRLLEVVENKRTKPLVNHSYNIEKLTKSIGNIEFQKINDYLLE